jgi:phytoene/squalene synthetase
VKVEEKNAGEVNARFGRLAMDVSQFNADVVEKALKQAQTTQLGRLQQLTGRISKVEADLMK